jgi:pimeloyl-ACP methyl ester carboxylesterase
VIRRAVGWTTPVLPTFTSPLESTTFSIKVSQDPPLGTTPDALARTHARFVSFGSIAESRLKDIGPYVSTPFVARDMLAITKAHGFDKLKFWGASYGTVLGTSTLWSGWVVLTVNRSDVRFYVP